MFTQSPCEYYGPMSFQPDSQEPEMDPYYGTMAHWPSSYEAISNPYNAPIAYQNPAILTPASLPGGSYAHTQTSPVVSHHSQEYQYPVSTNAMGLGITTTPYPRELTQNAPYGLGIAPTEYESRVSPAPSSRRRTRRASRQSATRDVPVTIAPNPEQARRIAEQQRLQEATYSQRAQAPRKGRRNPNDDDMYDYVEYLRTVLKVPWKEVVRECSIRFNRNDLKEPMLQMGAKRRRENAQKARRWGEHDVHVLLRARDFWEREKFKLISRKMKELGATNTFSPQECEAQLKWLEAEARERGEQEHNNTNQQTQDQATNGPRRKRRRANSTRETEANPSQNDTKTARGRRRPKTTRS
ncbi:uncharacterized protein BDV14DRAFT_108900 [Aspergillus stella-maris]|uniref:uncharacterized protein n=1 Tax=Aspergillus stella-maris TaxID=1810926 RepID=UPI003CCCAAD4